MPNQPTAPEKHTSHEKDFTLFTHLPADIRQEVWAIAASSADTVPPGSSTPGVCFYTEEYKIGDDQDTPPRLVVHEPYNKGLLKTNTEAHDIALMSKGPMRAYNCEIDILYMTTSLSWDRFLYDESSLPLRLKARHIALPLSAAGIWGEVPGYTRRPGQLPSLKTISIVFPGSSGTFSCSEGMRKSDKTLQRMALRRLAPEELDGITIKSQFTYNTWAGDYSVDSSSTGPEYLKDYEVALKRQAESEGFDDGYSFDAKTMIRWEARCFEAWPSRKKFYARTKEAPVIGGQRSGEQYVVLMEKVREKGSGSGCKKKRKKKSKAVGLRPRPTRAVV
ncbi:hypothetical protein QBC40DRAFT_289197 [Triangularia verruculosa]|uniref:2EXR domain-containing protein n=1 Tax=Triangularia verruculosa TaxID=2587418 RepID=A0AAN6X7L9_9PEZI|nr:hypothetical protein QBC40DRAFT_289197 [Triangularia verruculosa]